MWMSSIIGTCPLESPIKQAGRTAYGPCRLPDSTRLSVGKEELLLLNSRLINSVTCPLAMSHLALLPQEYPYKAFITCPQGNENSRNLNKFILATSVAHLLLISPK